MNKKIIVTIFGVVIIILSLAIQASFNTLDHNLLEQTFVISAVYFENEGYAEISFLDLSSKTKHITLEILGMPASFHKEYTSTTFVEKIQLSVPKYGWQSIPITISVVHQEFGNIGIKTEIRPIGEAPAKIIFSKLDI